MNKLNILTIVNSILLLSLIVCGILYFNKGEGQKMGYLDNVKLFNEFNMTKDIKAIEERKIKEKAMYLDSVYKQFQSIKDASSDVYKVLQTQVARNSKELQEMQNNYTENLSQQVWNRLNMYVSEYCEKEGVELLFGTNGDGNIMHAEDKWDITDKILLFSNSKYEGN